MEECEVKSSEQQEIFLGTNATIRQIAVSELVSAITAPFTHFTSIRLTKIL
jgi:hypothetical protein